MRKWQNRGFVMAESLLALGITTLVIVSLLLWQRQLLTQQRVHQVKLTAARLAKESNDQYNAEHCPVVMKRRSFKAVANHQKVTVWYQNKLVVQIDK